MERWTAVVGFEGMYEVSDLGKVRSVTRTIETSNGQYRKYKGKILRSCVGSGGYHLVQLAKAGKNVNGYIHQLVCKAFRGVPIVGHEVRHLDGDQTNNVLSNLEYGTSADNTKDREAHGTLLKGESIANSKLKSDEVLAIRSTYPRLTADELAEIYGVSQTAILNIIHRKAWKHI